MRLAERPVPEPGPGQLRVRLARDGVNPPFGTAAEHCVKVLIDIAAAP
jgi:NADPH:quinone reductase-like Zn-dependent oxidoreductase